MKRAAWVLALVAAAGCGDGHGHGDDGVVVVLHDDDFEPLTWTLVYSNGHPLLVEEPLSFQEAEMTHLINDHRVAGGKDALFPNLAMEDAARAHSVHMEIGPFYGTINPEGDDAADRADLAGIPFFAYGEFVGFGFDDPFDMFGFWLDGPEHALIDDPFWTDVGVGVHAGYWTVDFREL